MIEWMPSPQQMKQVLGKNNHSALQRCMLVNESSPCEYVQIVMITGLALETSYTKKKYYAEMIKSKYFLKENTS